MKDQIGRVGVTHRSFSVCFGWHIIVGFFDQHFLYFCLSSEDELDKIWDDA